VGLSRGKVKKNKKRLALI